MRIEVIKEGPAVRISTIHPIERSLLGRLLRRPAERRDVMFVGMTTSESRVEITRRLNKPCNASVVIDAHDVLANYHDQTTIERM